ncbi:nucleotide-binding protein [Geothrix sp. SG200]|uniref:TIR domain-containing protein n=1 Tax=Geothrix sp. SG200 TaxID=2922865 RepID=UPI001FAD2474|nr:nucleotide-binding protein [Geothrix sp. SG200]
MDSRLARLEQLLEEGRGFTFDNFCLPGEGRGVWGGPDSPEWATWQIRTQNLINQTFLQNSPAINLVNAGRAVNTNGYGPEHFEYAKSSIIKGIELAIAALKEDVFNEVIGVKSENKAPNISNKIFIVHGHDHSLKTELEAFLHQIGLEPIVLHRKPDEGQTIIEKFEQHSDVGFAFVLLTPDEIAYSADQDGIDDSDRVKEFRARPNVIFEFGYFVAKLSRSRVCCLYRGNVSIPSDLSGLLYKKVDSSFESQAFSIIKELKAAGYSLKI